MSAYQNALGYFVVDFIIDGNRYTFGRVPGSPNAFPTIEAAEDYERLAKAILAYEAESGLFKTTDSLFLQYYVFLSQNLRKNTAYAYHRAFNNYWLPLFKGRNLVRFSEPFLRQSALAVYGRLERNVTNVIASGKAFVRFLQSFGLNIRESVFDPTSEMKDRVRRRKEYIIYDRADFDCYLRAIENQKDRFLFSLFFFYGLRMGELNGLKWEDIHDGRVYISHAITVKTTSGHPEEGATKTENSIRDYPVLDVLRPYIDTFSKQSGYIFEGRFGPMSQTEIRRRHERYAKKAGLPVIRIHDFRHSCGSHLLRMGAKPAEIADWLGDTVETVLRVYVHVKRQEKDALASYMQ